MLNLIRRLLRNRRRNIFRYWDGARMRAIDPICAWRGLNAHKTFDPEKHIGLADAGDAAALAVTIGAVRDVFHVKAWSEDVPGLTEIESMDLLQAFIDYLDRVKKNGSPSPTLPESTVSQPPERAAETTNAPSASGSIDSEPNCGGPAES